jgi:hemolysin activation/secretion protein
MPNMMHCTAGPRPTKTATSVRLPTDSSSRVVSFWNAVRGLPHRVGTSNQLTHWAASRSVTAGAIFALAMVCLIFLNPRSVCGQDFERYRPRFAPPNRVESKLPEEPKPATGDPTPLVGELKALVFLSDKGQVVRDRFTYDDVGQALAIKGTGLRLLRSPAFAQRMQPYLRKPVSIRSLNELVRDVILFYRRNNQPVVDVSIPEQNVRDGVLQILVTEARVGRVLVEDADYFNPCMLARQVCTRPGQPIYESTLNCDVEWLNRNPFRSATVKLRPGKEPGTTDVIYSIDDRPPIRAYVGYEDTGTSATGLERTIYGMNYGNLWGLDHQIGYQYTASANFQSLSAHSASYLIPLLNRDTLLFYGSYATINTLAAAPTTTTGEAWQTSGRYTYNIDSCGPIKSGLTAGFDFKQTNTNLDLGGTTVSATSAQIAQMEFGYFKNITRETGSFATGVDLFISPGGFSSDNNTAAFNAIRPGATANYIYSRAFAERQLLLSGGRVFMMRITGQISDANLLANEQLGFGGFNSIRGYDQRTANGDSGYLGTLELRSKPMHLGMHIDKDRDQFQALAFFDGGQAYVHTFVPGQPGNVDLGGTGIGARYAIGSRVTARCDYGWQITPQQIGTTTFPSRAHVGLIFAH